MDASGKARNLEDFPLDILGQTSRINRLYTQITFCFSLADDSLYSQSEVINTLTQGAERLSASFPWVAGKVVNEHGTFKIKPCEKNPRLVIKDYRHDPSVPDWNALREANFPFSMLEESIIAPCRTLTIFDESGPELPVFLVQVNFVTGGLLLTFNGQHGSMDMTGQAQVIHLLAKACRNEQFTPSELSVGNMDRKNIIPLLDDTPAPEVDPPMSMTSTNKQSQQAPLQSQQLPNYTWAYFVFPASSLAALKSRATATVPSGSFVSTDDVLSAFTWQSITRARLPRFKTSPTANSTLSRNVDLRRYLSIPPSYPGLVTNATLHNYAIDTLVKEPLGSLAAQLRSALDPATLRHRACTLATLISHEGNATKASFVPTSVPELDVRLSSWAKETCSSLEFGFGKPEAVRRPRFTEGAREGLVYFLPRTLDGEITVGVCLRDEDLERLKGDEVFAEFGTYIG